MKVDVYKNLHEDCISVRSRESEDYGRVVAHRPCVTIVDAEFVVQPSGREKVVQSGVKNVHAFVRGEWNDDEKVQVADAKVDYWPKHEGQFIEVESERPVDGARRATVTTNGVLAKGLRYADDKVEI